MTKQTTWSPLTSGLAEHRLSDWIRSVSQKVKQEFLVERHAYTSVVLYEVTADDLDQMERETLSVSEDFSFAIAAIAIAVSFSIALATTTIQSDRVFTVFTVVTVIGYLSGIYFGIKWFRGRREFKGVAKRIRERGGPLGQEGMEIAASELVRMTEQAAPAADTEGRK